MAIPTLAMLVGGEVHTLVEILSTEDFARQFLMMAFHPQVKAVIEVLVTFAEFFQGRGRWEACARWCERAITLAKGLPNQSVAASSALASTEMGPRDSRKGIEGEAAPLLLASLLTLRGNKGRRRVPQLGFVLCSWWLLLTKCVRVRGGRALPLMASGS